MSEPLVKTSLGNCFNFSDLVGDAKAAIDTKHKAAAVKVAEKVVQVGKDGVISYEKHGVDMTKEGDSYSTLQLGARSCKSASMKSVAGQMTTEQSQEQARLANDKLHNTQTMRCVGMEKVGKNKFSLVYIDTAGQKTQVEVQQEILSDKEDEFAAACALGHTEALMWLQDNLLNL